MSPPRLAPSVPCRGRRIAVLILASAIVACDDGRLPVGPGPSVAHVEVTAADTTIEVGAIIQLTARAYDSEGAELNQADFVWTSSLAATASVDPATGVVTAMAPGTVQISALESGSGRIASITLVVVRAPVIMDPPLTTPECSTAAGASLYSRTTSPGRWTRDASPHVVLDSVVVRGRLEIEAGAIVCGVAGATLTVDTLAVSGTADMPVLLLPGRDEFWGGLRVWGDALIQHAVIESAVIPVTPPQPSSSVSITIEDSRILRTRAHWFAYALTLRRVDVDSACYAASCTAAFTVLGTLVLQDVRIRDSGGAGAHTTRRCSLSLTDVSIEGSAGPGLSLPFDPGGPCSLSLSGTVRVTGGQSYGIVGGPTVLQFLQPDRVPHVIGNALDTLVVDWPATMERLVVPKLLPVSVTHCQGPYGVSNYRHGHIMIEAGATLTVAGGCHWRADLRMHGTEAEPATLRGPGLIVSSVATTDTARVQHARLSGVRIRADSSLIVFQDIRMDSSSLELLTPGSRIDSLISIGSGAKAPLWQVSEDEPPAAVVLTSGTSLNRAMIRDAAVDGVRVLGDAVVRECTITRSVRDGVRIDSGALSVDLCNLVDNGGAGVNNLGAITTDAADNWWGDEAGPLGPAGDGVEGSVDYTPWLTEPVAW